MVNGKYIKDYEQCLYLYNLSHWYIGYDGYHWILGDGHKTI